MKLGEFKMKLENEEGSKESYLVRCRGLPWSATKDEIADFFENCELADEKEKSIIISKNQQGRPSGEAYVILASEDDLNEALKKDRGNMGKRYVEVFTAKYDEVEWAMNRSDNGKPNKDNVVKLRGLPFNSSTNDIVKFFEGIQIDPSCIMLTNDSMGRSSGEAYVQFTSQESFEEAMKKNRQHMGERYIEIFPSSMTEAFNERMGSMTPSPGMRGRPGPYDRSPSYGRGFGRNMKGFSSRPSFSPVGMGGMPQSMGAKVGHLIRMRGLPFSATEMDVAEWFSPVADPIQVAIEYTKEGRPSGDANVYFRTAEDANSAMSKNKQNMQHRYIELFNDGTNLVGMGGQGPIGYGVGREMMGSGLKMGMGGNIGSNAMTTGMGMSGMGFGYAGGMAMGGGGFDLNSGINSLMFSNITPQSLNSLGGF